jgi:hypothetical protein
MRKVIFLESHKNFIENSEQLAVIQSVRLKNWDYDRRGWILTFYFQHPSPTTPQTFKALPGTNKADFQYATLN